MRVGRQARYMGVGLVLVSMLAGCRGPRRRASEAPAFADEHGDEVFAGPNEVQLYVEARMALEADPPNPQQAHEIMARLLSKYPRDANLHLTHAEAFAGMAKYGQATKAWNEAKRLGAPKPSLDRVAAMIPKLREQAAKDAALQAAEAAQASSQVEAAPSASDPCQQQQQPAADAERDAQSEAMTQVRAGETTTGPGNTKVCPPVAEPDERGSDPADSPHESKGQSKHKN